MFKLNAGCLYYFFSEKVPEISPKMNTKLVFRAVNMGNVEAVKDLLARTEGVTNVSMFFYTLLQT